MDSKFTSNPKFEWVIRKKWSHDDLLTSRFQNWWCLQKTTLKYSKDLHHRSSMKLFLRSLAELISGHFFYKRSLYKNLIDV